MLLHELLTDEVKKRITPQKALQHPFITGETDTVTPKSLPGTTARRTQKGSGQNSAIFQNSNPLTPNSTGSTSRETGNFPRPRSSSNMAHPSSFRSPTTTASSSRPDPIETHPPLTPNDKGPSPRKASVSRVLNESELMQSLMSINMGTSKTGVGVLGHAGTGLGFGPTRQGMSVSFESQGAGEYPQYGTERSGKGSEGTLPSIDR